MLLMALDHARYFLSDRVYQPEDLLHSDLPLFLTRWVTHFCAPAFFFIAGIAAWLAVSRRDAPAVRRFLAIRGLWMIALELTVIGFAWSFVPGQSFAGVIWAFGWTFLGLALALRLGPTLVGLFGLCWLVVQERTDLAALPGTPVDFVVGILARPGSTVLPLVGEWFVLFPVLPWMAVTFMGYGCGPLFERDAGRRRRTLLVIGLAATALFLVLRGGNLFGNPETLWITGGPGDFAVDAAWSRTLISLLNTEKYPPSFQFLLMTLGPTLVALGWLTRLDAAGTAGGVATRMLATVGRVPMFFYIAHLYLVHLVALAAAALAGQRTDWLGWMGGGGHPRDGSGFGLPAVYAAWILVCALLWAGCAGFSRIKRDRGDWWLRYL